MKTILLILASLLFPICWGAIVNWLFTLYQRRFERYRGENRRINYHI
jgi:hypothetical protein